MDYGVSMVLAPGIGLHLGWTIHQDIQQAIRPDSFAALAERCARTGVYELCSMASLADLLVRGSLAVLAASVLLPLLYYFAIRSFGSNRDGLARNFPWLTRSYLVLVVLLLVAQGGVVGLGLADAVWTGALHSGLLVILIGLFALGLLASALSVLTDISRALAVEPVQVTAVVAGPDLHMVEERVQSVAKQLGVAAPDHMIVGIEPNVFVTAAPVRLRGNGELRDGTTLYLPAPLLRILSASELDALLVRELSSLKESPAFTGKLVPMSASVASVTSYVDSESDDQQGPASKLARIPASAFLSVMQASLRSALRRIRKRRETAADQAAVRLTDSKALFSALAKIAALNLLWQSFRHAYELYMLRGQTRRNLSLDFLAHVGQYATTTNPAALRDALIEARTPHAFDVNDTLAERADAQSVQIAPIVAGTAAQLTQAPKPSNVLASLEEQITAFENDYFRIPGRRVAVNQEDALPAELAPSLPA